MYTKITLYETTDKKRFPTKQGAINHTLDRMRGYLDKRLNKLTLHKHDNFKIIMELIPDDPIKAMELLSALDQIIGGFNEDMFNEED